MISIKNISKVYGDRKVLGIDSLEITKGETFGLVGNNGAGKSQILQALATGLSWFVNGIRNEMSGFEIDNKLIKITDILDIEKL